MSHLSQSWGRRRPGRSRCCTRWSDRRRRCRAGDDEGLLVGQRHDRGLGHDLLVQLAVRLVADCRVLHRHDLVDALVDDRCRAAPGGARGRSGPAAVEQQRQEGQAGRQSGHRPVMARSRSLAVVPMTSKNDRCRYLDLRFDFQRLKSLLGSRRPEPCTWAPAVVQGEGEAARRSRLGEQLPRLGQVVRVEVVLGAAEHGRRLDRVRLRRELRARSRRRPCPCPPRTRWPCTPSGREVLAGRFRPHVGRAGPVPGQRARLQLRRLDPRPGGRLDRARVSEMASASMPCPASMRSSMVGAVESEGPLEGVRSRPSGSCRSMPSTSGCGPA